MIRETLAPDAAHTMIASTGNFHVQHLYRESAGGITRSHQLLTGTKQVYLRLVKEGSKITSYYKLENDEYYEKVYESDVTFTGSSFFVGIAATSHIQGSYASLTVRSFEIRNQIWVPIAPPHLGEFVLYYNSVLMTKLYVLRKSRHIKRYW